MGRQELMPLYERCGMEFLPFETQSGAVTYRLMHAPISKIARQSNFYADRLKKSVEKIRWQLPFLFSQPSPCFHGGAFFASVGERFGNLERHKEIINADVLDAWFPPAPGVIDSLKKDLPWLLRTSPPTDCAGLIAAIAEALPFAPEAPRGPRSDPGARQPWHTLHEVFVHSLAPMPAVSSWKHMPVLSPPWSHVRRAS